MMDSYVIFDYIYIIIIYSVALIAFSSLITFVVRI